jgi:hypothetical protein
MFTVKCKVNGISIRDRKYASDMEAIEEMKLEFMAIASNGPCNADVWVQSEDGKVISRLECEGERAWINRGL